MKLLVYKLRSSSSEILNWLPYTESKARMKKEHTTQLVGAGLITKSCLGGLQDE